MLCLLFGKHNAEQMDLMDAVAERIQLLGGTSIASAADVAEMTTPTGAAGGGTSSGPVSTTVGSS
jgi:DNA-binding ferritin-like protein